MDIAQGKSSAFSQQPCIVFHPILHCMGSSFSSSPKIDGVHRLWVWLVLWENFPASRRDLMGAIKQTIKPSPSRVGSAWIFWVNVPILRTGPAPSHTIIQPADVGHHSFTVLGTTTTLTQLATLRSYLWPVYGRYLNACGLCHLSLCGTLLHGEEPNPA